ncbi:hypothetical protein AD006_28950 (plasmid) [Pseudonocardia sp. EC080610-09]|uniref:hypothetical protein n=1 Tax=unclassified Pseudonocardia TaxID=2619320 RepID=UPI000706BB03|nr:MULTISPECIES: hypothetical protein [unclassified Pseudonocardia]ALL79330.1 hypothetical protein AD006_28950 [Pseudonocardia sp. EC080610-09]ALL85301.1 hypothetical protein AD017_29340 [Pseudonocardia sp. EC080619-01]
MPATLVIALGVSAALTFTELPSAPVAQAAGPIDATAAAPTPVRRLVPPPPLPARVIPDFPLPQPVTTESEPVTYTCDPTGDPEFGDPANPHLITNKDCPALNAAKEQAQREYLEQLNSDVVGDHREYTCSDPSSSDYGTAACGTDADGDGLMDGGPLDTD